ncbi:MAG: DoxX family protein [Acidihalobacter sp.]
MYAYLQLTSRLYAGARKALDFAAPLGDLAIRLVLAQVFWYAGLAKLASMSSTVALFEYVYHVPLLPPVLAAWLGMLIEVIFSVLLASGTATRFTAFVLFVYNIIAVISYPDLHGAALYQQFLWGVLLLAPMFHGAGALSVDYLALRWWRRGHAAAALADGTPGS